MSKNISLEVPVFFTDSICAKAIALDPKLAIAYNCRGAAFEGLGRREEAIADFRRALVLDPKLQMSKESLARLGASP
jgi:tetratricopeptide (TPR) repeat protein